MKRSGTTIATRAGAQVIKLLRRRVSKPVLATRKPRASFGLDKVLRPTEDQIQIAVISWLRLMLPKALIFHVANERKCTPEQGAYLKKKGVLAGVPDIMIVLPEGRCIMMEVKTVDGVMSDDQRSVRDFCNAARIPHAVVQSVDDARMALESFHVVTRESRP